MSREIVERLRARLLQGQRSIRNEYEQHGTPTRMLHSRSKLVDGILIELWQVTGMPTDATLVAVGGYGRGELYPCSDVDILVLLGGDADPALSERIQQFIGQLWDLGLDIGHSVRTVEECIEEATRDVTVQTNLLESRRLTGSQALYRHFVTGTTGCFDPESFFHAKRAEQEQRYNRFNHTPYAVEPNCKESPGGLRDLQTIIWIALASGLGTRWSELARHGLITREEVNALRKNERLLQQVRIRLHYIANRREDRLIFDHQEALAKAFGLKATKARRASEVMMQRYYLAAKKITQLNTILLQNLGARYQPLSSWQAHSLNERFQSLGDQLDIVDDALFERHPSAILEAFLLMEQHAELKGMTVRTLRALWHARKLITPAFRRDSTNRGLFLQLLQEPRGQTHEFRRLNQYSILGTYLPNFGRIVGQMQHDLFHAYTVDQHILQVLRNVRRFLMEEHAHEYPLMTRLASEFERPWLLFVAALFHDIAKGRGGDHSTLGMADARRFCREHGLSKEDNQLVVWLVQHHLTMSQIAQKQDLSDPDVIRKFVALVRTERRLAALYILTHADIRGTSPKVWNGWKANLLEALFLASRQLLRGKQPDQVMGISERQEAVRQKLRFFGLRPDSESAFWRELDTLYFLRHDADEIAWHTRMLYYRPRSEEPVVKARPSQVEAGIQVMVYTRDQQDLFVRLCAFFARMGYSIVDAKIHTTSNGYALDSFVVMDPNERDSYRDVIALIEHELSAKLARTDVVDAPSSGRLSRQLKHFPIAPSVSLQPDERGQHYILSIIAADRPGLLFLIARILAAHEVNLHTAKIATLGERAEDTFLVSGPLLGNSAKTVQLEADLLEALKI
ncbi:[protein-PII] uridylyltransferase [Uliginosibacterium sp. 31-12]|uniref:[protein-PII] uridylyltransferase n=1 Tax=Uliginosibacterium sp. 31-12 TaxID=3062781 RepID=UPI0026E2E7F0|nr:[protein-PII] uridylyltransferase [Uliginosibacterium sp. 31-12]MDO6385217.1 [protein-PII] uridylyltransferase [Uliginosibacterium sp. 31-12]